MCNIIRLEYRNSESDRIARKSHCIDVLLAPLNMLISDSQSTKSNFNI